MRFPVYEVNHVTQGYAHDRLSVQRATRWLFSSEIISEGYLTATEQNHGPNIPKTITLFFAQGSETRGKTPVPHRSQYLCQILMGVGWGVSAQLVQVVVLMFSRNAFLEAEPPPSRGPLHKTSAARK